MNLSNGVPPERTHVPGPIAALNVSGSQASIMVIGRSSPPTIACVVAVDPPFEVGMLALVGEPMDDEAAVGADGFWSQLAANAIAASTTSTRRLMSPPFVGLSRHLANALPHRTRRIRWATHRDGLTKVEGRTKFIAARAD
jgi:hypothetical protein